MKIDDSDCDRFEAAAIRRLRRSARRMKRILDAAAASERRTHAYKNRTRQLQTNTRASDVVEVGDQSMVMLEMDTDYASYVVAKGLSRIDEVAKMAEGLIEDDFNLPADTED